MERAGSQGAQELDDDDSEDAPLPDMQMLMSSASGFIATAPPRKNWINLFRLMNREFGFVPVVGKAKYKSISPDGELWFRSHEDVAAIFKNVLVGKANAFDARAPGLSARTYAGVCFFPGSRLHPPRVPSRYVNTWQGFQVQPRRGSWSLLDNHLRKVCLRRELYDLAIFLDHWLAQLVQVPQEKPCSCLVLKSSVEGSGKSMLVNSVLKPIFGHAATTIDKSSALTGRFNSFMERNIVLGIEEAIWAGSKADAGVVKNVITNPMLKVERKGSKATDV